MDTLPPRTALVTGATRGIGAEIARRLAFEGYHLTISARSGDAVIESANQLERECGIPVVPFAAEMSEPDQIRALVEHHAERFGAMNALVLSAGTGTAGPIEDLEGPTFEMMLDVNLRAPLALIQHSLPLLRKAAAVDSERGARVIALASLAGVASERGLAAYGATKAALISLCQTVSVEESVNGVSATALSPGYVDTDMTAWKRSQLDPTSMLTVGDVAELAIAVARLSPHAVVPNIIVTRAGDHLWRA